MHNRLIPTWRVTAYRLRQLMEDARQGCRIYEVLLIARPRDVIPYLDVIITGNENVMTACVQLLNPWRYYINGWQLDELASAVFRVPYRLLAKINYESNDTFDWNWNQRVSSHSFRKFIRKLIIFAQREAIRLRNLDNPFFSIDIQRFDSGTHTLDQVWLTSGGNAVYPNTSRPNLRFLYSKRFYSALEHFLALPFFNSFGYVCLQGAGDYQVLQLAWSEQLRRGQDFPVHAMGYPFNHGIAWDDEYSVSFPDEPDWVKATNTTFWGMGFGNCDLYLGDGIVLGNPNSLHYKHRMRKAVLYPFVINPPEIEILSGFFAFNHPNGWSVQIRAEFPDLIKGILTLFPELVPCLW